MKTMKTIIASTCCAAVLLAASMARAAFELIPPATDTNACVYQLASNKARIEFSGWRSSSTIATSDYAVIALKHVAAILSVDSARVAVNGFPATTFNFSMQPSCSSEFSSLFGSTATAFSDNPANSIPSHTPATLKFNVTLKPGKTISDLIGDLGTGNPFKAGDPVLGGSPVAGSGKSFTGSMVTATSALSCLQPGAVLEGCNYVSACTGLPAAGGWGYAALAAALLVLGVVALRKRTHRSHAP